MAAFLYRLGRVAFRRRKIFLLGWILLVVGCVFAAVKAPEAPSDGFSVPGTESQKAYDLLDERFPGTGSSDGAQARIVFVAPDGQKITASDNKATVDKVLDELADGSQVKSIADPFEPQTVSKDGSTAYATVTYKETSDELTDASTTALENAADEGREAGLTVEIGGSALDSTPESSAVTELIGVGVAAIVLILTFGSLVAAGLPLITALIGIAVGVASITALGSTFGLSSTASTLAMMIGLAVGIDYAVFIVSRYRSERADGYEPEEAVGRAVGTSGSAVVFAGLTVVIALAGLSVVGIPMLAKMGLSAAGTVIVAVLVALTLIPALLGFFQNAVLPRKARKGKAAQSGQATTTAQAAQPADTKEPIGVRWARFVTRRPVAVLLFSALGLGVIALPVVDLQLGLPGDEAKSTDTTQRRAYDDLADAFGPGFNGPLTIVVDAKKSDDPKDAAARTETQLKETKGIVSVSPAVFNEAGDTATITATPSTAPTSSDTEDLVHTIRDESDQIKDETDAKILVTGTTALNIDTSQTVTDALLPYLAIVVGLAFLLLMVVFRSLLVPLKAALGFLFSLAAAFGVIVAVFQWGWGADLLGVETTGPVMSMMPIFLIGVVFGLAMDYEVFLVTRIREAYVHGAKPDEAIVSGFRHSARVVAAAAVIMIAVFAGFIGQSESMIKMMGLGLACAVFFDAFVVRMTIVPAVLALLGDRAWSLPGWLAKVVPTVDIEGEKLSRSPAVEAGAEAEREPTRA